MVCKKWHVAKRVLEQMRQATNLPALEYLFSEQDTALPDLGGIQNSLGKRTRHRRSLMRMLFDYYDTDQLIVCMDPGDIDLLNDFAADRSVTRVLEIECQFSDDYLVGHAKRVGLAGERTSVDTLERLLPTIRNDLTLESDRIRDAQFENYARVRETASAQENTEALAAFLRISPEQARPIAETHHLFTD